MDKMSIYNRLPVWGQNLACYYEGSRIKHTRYGKDFWRFLAEYESRADWSYEQLCDYRDARLRKMIRHCYDTVPYYTRLFNDSGINPDSIKALDDLKVLPILTKDIVKADPESFVSTAIPCSKIVVAHTSGTTGSGFVFKTTQEAICEQWAVWWRYRRALGIEYGTLCGQFGGKSVVPVDSQKPPFFRWNKPQNMMYFSTYHMSQKNLGQYISAIRKNNVEWIHGYPSAINMLAEYIAEHGIDMNIKYVTTGAENLLESQKQHIVRAFNVQPYEHYGMSEAVANFAEDAQHRMFVDEDFVAVEFLPLNGSGNYEIVGSNITNFAMPLLRYKTGDTANISVTKYGRQVSSVDGRMEDYVTLPNGAKVGRLDHVFKNLINIREAQIIQKSLNKIQVNVVKGAMYGPSDERQLYDELALRLIGITTDIVYVNSITRTATGKLRFVISKIKN